MISTISSNSSAAAAGGTDSTDFIKKMFAKTDTDGDGKVTQDEFVTALEKRLGKTSTDANAPDATEVFKKVDSDSDGSITASEFETAFKTVKSQGGGGGTPPPSGPPPSGGSDDSTEVFDVLDTNEDGTVSIEELMAGLASEEADEADKASNSADIKSMFESIDSDGDGALTESEFKSMLEKMQENRPPPEATYAVDGSTSSSPSAGILLDKQV